MTALSVDVGTDPAPGHPELPLQSPIKDESVVNLPEGVKPPPVGYAFYGKGPLKKISPAPTTDILEWEESIGWTKGFQNHGWHGATDSFWAVRIGSPIAEANQIGVGISNSIA
jgi:hypothetical protein